MSAQVVDGRVLDPKKTIQRNKKWNKRIVLMSVGSSMTSVILALTDRHGLAHDIKSAIFSFFFAFISFHILVLPIKEYQAYRDGIGDRRRRQHRYGNGREDKFLPPAKVQK